MASKSSKENRIARDTRVNRRFKRHSQGTKRSLQDGSTNPVFTTRLGSSSFSRNNAG
jgi:hypothetical protein